MTDNTCTCADCATGKIQSVAGPGCSLPAGQRVSIEAEFVKEIDYVNDDGPGYVPGVMLMVAGKTVCVRADAIQADTPKVDWNALVMFMRYTQDGWNVSEAAEKAGIEFTNAE
jgi:hypothetical protein